MIKRISLLAALAFAACTPEPDRLALAQLDSALELRPLVSSAMVRTVSLPTYAAAEEIAVETGAGLIASNTEVLWADDPQRAMTIAVARNLGDILGIDAGPEPWPFLGLPDVSIDVRVERVLAYADGTFRLSGQFYVGGDGSDFRNQSRAFAISKPMPDLSLPSIATAQAEAVLTLSEEIAKTIGR
ncbi:PqiC family protein [Yoonia sediminilitoris]|uniref:ABC-type transport auxiliary lipoprotein component domain-containing protein n=1 Tax=Yoonia sediminilitoris TaxID=1286148 RepID=A0A2T6KR40_9RHOB|nr:ABC-type transport auxiliary lipoprotein family protein [Yoonia sediminilitoris]PUB19017.1 hypothetical protein C8N45_101608 [Yoonia sediminilitoris]RCW99185.1 hypothetical protein DFP92_101608 [Yoonia sediminilitoris]